MDFYKWLLRQTERKDVVGRFARAFEDIDTKRLTKKRSRRRRVDTHKRWADIIIRRNNSLVPIFNDVWSEFEQHRERAEAA